LTKPIIDAAGWVAGGIYTFATVDPVAF
jgi:hypothetical protein